MTELMNIMYVHCELVKVNFKASKRKPTKRRKINSVINLFEFSKLQVWQEEMGGRGHLQAHRHTQLAAEGEGGGGGG